MVIHATHMLTTYSHETQEAKRIREKKNKEINDIQYQINLIWPFRWAPKTFGDDFSIMSVWKRRWQKGGLRAWKLVIILRSTLACRFLLLVLLTLLLSPLHNTHDHHAIPLYNKHKKHIRCETAHIHTILNREKWEREREREKTGASHLQ